MTRSSEILISDLESVLNSKIGFSHKVFHYFSPGRINLIGEHVDYKGTGGLVVPAAVNLGITAVTAKTEKVAFFSLNFADQGWVEFSTGKAVNYDPKAGFINMVHGAYFVLGSIGKKPGGFTTVLNSTIPTAAGMSSSAAFCVLILTILNDLYALDLSGTEIALLAQRIENEFIGLNSGIMDQFIVANGRKNHFMVLDTSTLKHVFISIPLGRYKFFIVNTAKSRVLAASAYNERVSELKTVMKVFHEEGYAFKTLAEAKGAKFLDLLKDGTLRRRFKHVLTEMSRVETVRSELPIMTGEQLGSILNDSHASLRDDYEVSCPEADFLHFKLLNSAKVYGARIMGAGFGGCLLVVAKTDTNLADLDFSVEYAKSFNLNMEVYEFETANGTRKII